MLATPLAGAVCETCWHDALPLPTAAIDLRRPPIAWLRALGPYEGGLRRAIQILKYDGRESVAARLGAAMAAAGTGVLDGADAVVPVPLHWRRRRSRGFNQAALLARQLPLPSLPLLRRTANTRPQFDLPAGDRRRNVEGAFAVTTPVVLRRRPDPRGRVLVLVDDVATTGATLDACADVLLAAGAREVRALTAARAGIESPR